MILTSDELMELDEPVWEVNDRYSECRAMPMRTAEGQVSNWAMVYSHEKDGWTERRPVSMDYQPVTTEMLVDSIMERVPYDVLKERVRRDPNGTRIQVRLALDGPPIRIPGLPHDQGSPTAIQGVPGRVDELRPMLEVTNSYDCTRRISVMGGWFRLICSNGLVIPAWDGAAFSESRLHYSGAVRGLLNRIGKWQPDYSKVPEQEAALRFLAARKMTDDEITALVEMLPVRRQQDCEDHMKLHRTAYAALCYTTNLQTHEYSISRSGVIQPAIEAVMKLAA